MATTTPTKTIIIIKDKFNNKKDKFSYCFIFCLLEIAFPLKKKLLKFRYLQFPIVLFFLFLGRVLFFKQNNNKKTHTHTPSSRFALDFEEKKNNIRKSNHSKRIQTYFAQVKCMLFNNNEKHRKIFQYVCLRINP